MHDLTHYNPVPGPQYRVCFTVYRRIDSMKDSVELYDNEEPDNAIRRRMHANPAIYSNPINPVVEWEITSIIIDTFTREC